MADFDPSLLFDDDEGPEKPLNEKGKFGGIRKMCTDHKRCGLGLTCEHAQVRNESCELQSLWAPTGNDLSGCGNWMPRKELCSENDIFRGKSRKHNQLRRSNPIITTKRHIRDGDDIA